MESEYFFTLLQPLTPHSTGTAGTPHNLHKHNICRIQSGMLVRKCISGEKSDIVLSNHSYDGRQIKAKWNNEEFGYFNTITKIANAILCSLFMFGL